MAETKKINATVDLVKSGVEFKLNGGTILSDDGTSHYLHSQSNLYLYSGSSNTMVLTNSGNVGIGTTSPTALLHIDGTNSVNGGIKIHNSGGNPYTIWSDNDKLYLNQGSTKAITVEYGGNVGIGSGNPDAQLHVESTGVTASGYKYHMIVDDNNAYGINNGGGIIFRGDYNSATAKANFGAIRAGKANANDGNANAYLSLMYGSSGSLAEGLRINWDGNVGIGTTSPQSKLHVQGGAGIFNVSDDWQQSTYRTHLFRGGGFNSSISEESTAVKIFNGSALDGKSVGNYWGGIGFMHLDPEYGSWGTSYTGEHFWIGGRLIDTPQQERSALVFATNNVTTAGSHSSEKMVILPNGNVGIGTTNPVQKLHVNDGGIRVEKYATGLGGFISVGNGTEVAGNYSAYFFGNTNQDNAYFKGGIAYETLSSTNGRGDMHFLQNSEANGTNADISDSVMTILNSGNVGIGTTSPSAKLDVSHTIRTTGSATPSSGKGVEIRYLSGDVGSVLSYNRGSSEYTPLRLEGSVITLRESGNSVLTVDGGNVGIGTTAPEGKIDVRGNYGRWRINGYGGMYFRNNSDTGYTRYIHPRSDGSLSFGRIADANLSGSDPDKFAASSYDQFYLDSSGTAFFNGGINFAGVNGANFVVDTDGQRIVWEHQRNGTRRMTFYHEADADTFNFNFESGNKLQINGNRIVTVNELGTAAASAATDFVAVSGDTMSGDLNFEDSNGNTRLTIGNITGASPYVSKIYTQNYHLTLEAKGTGQGQIRFNTGTSTATEKMRILENGNVGIGTTSPQSKLHVAKAGNSNGGSMLIGETGSGTAKWSFLAGSHYNQNTGSGNGSGSAGMAIIGSLSGSTYNRVYVGGGPYEINPATEIQFWTHTATTHTLGGSQRMVIKSNGNVGIGTTSPGAKLDVAGNILVSGGDNQISFYSSSQTGYRLYRNSTTMILRSDGNIKEDAGSAYIVSTNAAERLRVDSSGNVGIGATSPAQKLHVAGNIKATGWIGRDSSNYITFDETNNHIDFYAGGNWVARMEADGDLHVKGDVIAFSDIFNP